MFFAERGVDAVLHCGDITDLGYLSQLDAFISSWRRVMPSDTPLVAVFGNRDMSDTLKIPAEEKKRNGNLLISSAPGESMRRLCGWSTESGFRMLTVGGIPVVAADWKHEGELEAFMYARPDLRRAAVENGIIFVQHPHPQGTVFGTVAGSWMADDGRATCYLRMFPRAWSFSGHSHIPFTAPFGVWRGDFTAASAGSYYLGPPTATGGSEVMVLALWRDHAELERRDLGTGFHETTVFRIGKPASSSRRTAEREFSFAQWNIGHFSFGRHGDTDISAEDAPERAAAYRRAIDGIDADFMGVCEFSHVFDKGGGRSRDLVFGSFRSLEAGSHFGYQCNAIAAVEAPLRRVSVRNYRLRSQRTYWIACETEVFGKRVMMVETHLDLSANERKAQIAELVAEFGREERVIVSGDFNVSDIDEFRPFTEAGFIAANGGRFGTINTHRRRRVDITPAIDNVFVKGFSIRKVRTADDALELSDHRILVCNLVITK